MNKFILNFVNRNVNERLAKKAIKEANGDAQKTAAATLWEHLLIPIRNSFVYVPETQLQRHLETVQELFKSYVEKATLAQLEEDSHADERETFVKIFGDIQI